MKNYVCLNPLNHSATEAGSSPLVLMWFIALNTNTEAKGPHPLGHLLF